MTESKLNFVIGGAQKSGTSTLYHIFRRHPQIQMASIKETHFFDDESRDWECPDYTSLHAYFAEDDGRLRGEATPITLYWRPAIRRLHDYNPDMKFVVLLRNPIVRAFSNWRFEYAAGRETLTFKDAIRVARDRVRQRAEIEDLHRYVSYVDRGLYGQQLSYFLNYFPRRNIHCEIFEEFFHDRWSGMQRISAFLEIAPFAANMPEIHVNAAPDNSYPSILDEDDIAYLSALFRDDIVMVESFLGRSIPSWRGLDPVTTSGSAPTSKPFDQKDDPSGSPLNAPSANDAAGS